MGYFSDVFKVGPRHDQYLTEFFSSGKKIGIQDGAIQSAKTDSQIIGFLHQFGKYPGLYFICGRTYATTARNILDGERKLLDWIGNNKYKRDKFGTPFISLGNSKAYIFGADNRRAQDKLRGGTWMGGLFDELPLLDYDLIMHTIGRCYKKYARVFCACNPEGPYHPVKTNLIDGNPDVFNMSFGLRDNPIMTDETIAYIERQYKPGTVWHSRLVLGKWVMAEGIIYQSYRPAEHNYRYDAIDNPEVIIIGIDGGTAMPCCFELIYKKNGIYYNHNEYYWDPQKEHKQKSDYEYAQDFKKFVLPLSSHFKIYCDETAVSLMAELRRIGYRVISANTKAPGERVKLIDSLYHQGRIMQHERNTSEAIKQNNTYVWDENKQKQGKDEPKKENDHAVNARDYAIQGDYRESRTKQIR